MRKSIFQRILFVFVCVLSLHQLSAQQRVITGIINDELGFPLANATVSTIDESVSTTTDEKGAFRLSVSPSVNAIKVSYVGMITQEISIVGRSNITISMKAVEGDLGEVVVVGYGRAKRANLTSAQTTVSAKDIDKTVNTTIEQALQGRAAGVYVTQNSGQPGGGISVNIRGVSSLNRTQPLYVIDGVQIQQN